MSEVTPVDGRYRSFSINEVCYWSKGEVWVTLQSEISMGRVVLIPTLQGSEVALRGDKCNIKELPDYFDCRTKRVYSDLLEISQLILLYENSHLDGSRTNFLRRHRFRNIFTQNITFRKQFEYLKETCYRAV